MAGYTRQSTYTDGDIINAADSNDEFDQLVSAFANTTGHAHDGTAGEGPVIGLIGDAGSATPKNKIVIDDTNNQVEVSIDVSGTSTEQFVIKDGVIEPTTTNDVDLGTSSKKFKDAYFAGDVTVDGDITLGGSITLGDADTDSITLGAEVDSHVVPNTDDTYDLGSTTKEWRNLYLDGTANIDSLVADTADINGGTIDGATIGGTTAAAITGTTITGTSLVGPVTGNVTGDVTGDLTGNADTATALETARNFSLTGDVTATAVSFDGTGNVALSGSLAAGVVDTAELAASAVTDVKIATGTISNAKLVNDSVTVNTNAVALGASITLDTDDIGEGTSNLYFTDERVDDRVNGLLTAGSNITLTYDDSANTLTIASTDTEDDLSNNDTDDLAEGSTNLYYTDTRADARITNATGTSVQAYDAGLASIAGLTTAADKIIYTTAADTYAVSDISAFGRSLLDDANAGIARATLGLGTLSTQASNSVNIDGGNIDGTAIGATTRSTAQFSTLQVQSTSTLEGTLNLNDDLDMGDNNKIKMGTGDDLEIYHDSANSRINDSGTGSLKLQSANTDRVVIDTNVTIQGLVYPSSDGTNGQTLVTDGSGNLSFATADTGDGGIAMAIALG